MTRIAMLLGLALVGCSSGTTEVYFDEDETEAPEPEAPPDVQTVRDSVTAAGTWARATAVCPPDYHVKRGWCWFGHPGNTSVPALDRVPAPLGKRFSVHAPKDDGWQCGGEAAPGEYVRITAHAECESGGGMDTEP